MVVVMTAIPIMIMVAVTVVPVAAIVMAVVVPEIIGAACHHQQGSGRCDQ